VQIVTVLAQLQLWCVAIMSNIGWGCILGFVLKVEHKVA
jgi:hypothetical protein